MLSNGKYAFVLLLLLEGCVSSQVSMRIDDVGPGWRTATTRLKYHITSMCTRNPGTERMLKEAGGVNAALTCGYEYTQAQIRKMERQVPAVFDSDGVPVDIDIETATDSKMSLWQYPYYFLCGCSLCVLPFYNSWSDTSIYRVKVSSSSRTHAFSVVRKHEASFSLLGLNVLVPFFPLDGADFKYESTDMAEMKKVSELIMQAIVSALLSSEDNVQMRGGRKLGRTIGD